MAAALPTKEQAVWILGSIAAGEPPSTGGSGSGGSGGSGSGTAALTGGTSNGANGSASNSLATAPAPVPADNGGSSSKDKSGPGGVAARDVVLAAGVMRPLLRCLEAHPLNLSLQRIGAWTLSNLVEGQFQQQQQAQQQAAAASSSSGTGSGSGSGNGGGAKEGGADGGAGGPAPSRAAAPPRDYSTSDEIEIRALLPTLRRLLHSADAEVLSYTCWTLSHLCDGPSSHIAAVVTTPEPHGLPGGLVPRLVDLLLHPSWRVTKPALRTIGNIVCAECADDGGTTSAAAAAAAASLLDPNLPPLPADYTEVVLECDAVPRLRQLVNHPNREIQKEACWTLSNIAAGTVDQIQAVIDSGAVGPLVKLVKDGTTDQEVRSEACWVVLNATSCGSDAQIEVLVDEGCVSVLGVLLGEPSMVMMALEGLERVLQVEEARELARGHAAALKSGGGGGKQKKKKKGGNKGGANQNPEEEDKPPSPLVSASIIEKALDADAHHSAAVTKRASRIWKQHFVSCALCKESYSRHRPADARFCNECKCHVCCNCNCQVYHLSYQEELWADEGDAKKDDNKKISKSSKKKKKKAKQKEKKAAAAEEEERKKAEEEEARAAKKKAEEEEAARRKAEEEALRKKLELEKKRKEVESAVAAARAQAQAQGGKKKGKQVQQRDLSTARSRSSTIASASDSSSAGGRGASAGPPLAVVAAPPSTAAIGGKKVAAVVSLPTTSVPVAKEPPTTTPATTPKKKKKKKKGAAVKEQQPPNPYKSTDQVVAPIKSEQLPQPQQPDVDFVLYLEQTGSIIALAKLMDALDSYSTSDGTGYRDVDPEIDDELRMLRKQRGLTDDLPVRRGAGLSAGA
mmetsp:Transcript_57182/g.170461  ORF Transcript_57182/g.170461 Transcript_57182/m.170461 type:complete len:854 (-) Transcript_57182:415-2976(-)